MNLIIKSDLIFPPSDSMAVRSVTMLSYYEKFSPLIECSQDEKDKTYKYLKSKGCFDYIEDIILFNQENGVRIDKNNDFPMTICVKNITFENQIQILGQIKNFSNFFKTKF